MGYNMNKYIHLQNNINFYGGIEKINIFYTAD